MAKNKITLNVLADITKKLNEKDSFDFKNKGLVVFTGSNIDLTKKIEELNRLKEEGINLSIAFSFMGERILDTEAIIEKLNPMEIYREEDIFRLEEIVNSHSMVIGPNITINTLSKVSLGMIDSFVSNILWTYLYKKKNVYLDFTSVNNYLGSPSQNKVINNQIKVYIDNLKNMGTIEIVEGHYVDRIMGKQIMNQYNREETVVKDGYDSKKIITEKDLTKFSAKGDTLKLPKGSILTPLAKDKARKLGINIKIEE